ncbi:exodeoxyribonuclease VII small subunit, partial [Schnuerera sp.]
MKNNKMTYEEAINELEKIIEELEDEDLTLKS